MKLWQIGHVSSRSPHSQHVYTDKIVNILKTAFHKFVRQDGSRETHKIITWWPQPKAISLALSMQMGQSWEMCKKTSILRTWICKRSKKGDWFGETRGWSYIIIGSRTRRNCLSDRVMPSWWSTWLKTTAWSWWFRGSKRCIVLRWRKRNPIYPFSSTNTVQENKIL